MSPLPGRLNSLIARDVMTRSVIVVSADASIQDAVETLKQSRITGAPVVDEARKFVGILSVSDVVASGDDRKKSDAAPPVTLAHGEDAVTWDLFEAASPLQSNAGATTVRNCMSRQVTSVTESAPLVEVARIMCRGHWHRVPVVDDTGALRGIISTMDVLAAIVNVADEGG